jgi:hypothetical protein
MSVPKAPARVSRDAKMSVPKAPARVSRDAKMPVPKTSRGAKVRRVLRPVHVTLVGLITLGVLTQAVLAGQFISGTSNAIPAHGAVGGLLELTGLLLLIVAIAHRIGGERSRLALVGSLTLAIAINVQAVLGWMPGAVPTAVHVPLGVGIFAGAVALFAALVRRRTVRVPASSSAPASRPTAAATVER